MLFKQFDEKSLRAFRKEVAIMSKIFHPNIVLFLGYVSLIFFIFLYTIILHYPLSHHFHIINPSPWPLSITHLSFHFLYFLHHVRPLILSPSSYSHLFSLYRACTSLPGQLMICTELMSSNLEALLLNPHTKLALLPRMKMARDAALGILWLHSSNPVFIHRDLKVNTANTIQSCQS